MSKIKGCKRCRYDKTIYDIDYIESTQKQKICYKEAKVCSKCNYISPYEKILKREADIDNYPSDMIVDLSKIIHKHQHNHNKFDHIKDKIQYNNRGKCTKLTLIKCYRCDICNNPVDYREIEEITEYEKIYDKSEYEIDYKTSARKQKIYYTEIKTCSKSKRITPRKEYKIAELDNYPKDMIVDLSKIIHEHNHNKFSHIRDKAEYNNDICTKLTLIKCYRCDICDKIVDYTEIEEFKEYKDIYDKTEYIIDYKTSAQKQKIYYKEISYSSKSKHVFQKCESKIAELDNYPKDMIIDLSKIIFNNKKEDKVVEEKQNKLCNKEINKEQFNEKSKNIEKRIEIYDKINELDNDEISELCDMVYKKVELDNRKLNEDIFDIIHRMDIENLDDSDDDEITIIHHDNDHKSSNKCPYTGKKFYMRKGYVLDNKYKYNNCSVKPHVLFEECSECHRCFYAGMIYC